MIELNKKDYLLGNGTYNKSHKKVKSKKFIENDFFDPTDMIQVKYEMLKEVTKNGKSISEAATDFGFSRTAFYHIKEVFDKKGLIGLAPEKKGPKNPYKLTSEIQRDIDDCISENPMISSSEITKRVNSNKDVNISKRTVERYRSKKKQIKCESSK